MGWGIVVFFVVPDELLTSWLLTYTGDFAGSDFAMFGLLLLLLFAFLQWVGRRMKRFLTTLDRRDPKKWNDDLKRLTEASKAKAGITGYRALAALIIGGWTLGFILETALQLWLMA